MNISPLENLSFKASMTRSKRIDEVHSQYGRGLKAMGTRGRTGQSAEKKMIIQDDIANNRSAIALDTFLHTGSIKEKVEALPEQDEVFIDLDSIGSGNMALYYNAENEQSVNKLDMLDYDDASDLTFLNISLKRPVATNWEIISQWVDNLTRVLS